MVIYEKALATDTITSNYVLHTEYLFLEKGTSHSSTVFKAWEQHNGKGRYFTT